MQYALSDAEWLPISPVLPHKSRGIPRVEDRLILNGISWVLRSGAPRRDLPDRYGPRPPLATIVSFDGALRASGTVS